MPVSTLVPRPDLAVAPWTKPGLIGSLIVPTIMVNGKAGTLYARTALNTAAVQSGRTAADTVNTTNTGLSPIAWTLVEKLARRNRDMNQILPGTLEKALAELARQGKTGVAYALESMIAKIVLDTDTATASATQKIFISNVHEAVAAIAAYGKRVAVVMSQSNYNAIRQYSAIQSLIGKFVMAPQGTPVTPADYGKIQMAGIFGADMVLVGQNAAWNSVSYTNNGCVSVVALPDQGMDIDPTAEPLFGLMAVEQGFAEDVETPFTCQEGFDTATRAHFVDTVAFADELVLNSALVAAVALPTEASV